MFYQGSLQEGISTAVGQQKLVLCFVTNENEESQTWENEYLQDNSLSKLIETQAVALRLIAESEEAGYLSQIFPLPKTPTVVIMKHGELKEYIAAGTSKDDFLRRILVAFNAAPPATSAASSSASPSASPTRLAAPVPAPAPASVTAPAPSTSPSPASQTRTRSQSQSQSQPQPQPQPQSQSRPEAQLQAQVEAVGAAPQEVVVSQVNQVDHLLADRAAKLKAQKEEAEKRAKEERAKAKEKAKAEAQAAANTEGARVYEQAEQLKRRRQSELEERRRILKRIEDDREERRLRASQKEQQRIESRRASDAAVSTSTLQSKLPSTSPRKVSEMASIQVRLFDGSTIRSRFKTGDPLTVVREWVDETRGESKGPYTFKQVLTPLPNKNIDATEESKSIGELGLIPSSTLVLIPVQKYSSAYRAEDQQASPWSRFLALILGFFTWLLSLVGLGGEQGAGRGDTEIGRRGSRAANATARTASEERNRRVRGLQNLQRDHQLYNGNSLNFEPRPDDDDDDET
ncbi:hypothetical protein MKX07_008180 [Trichoderma sp. CBMAI-0711]|uniref:UBX domain-containing protein 2 n=1 Tax=Trichoderma parareesei TaxID=858221 RepID=A0A2H2ZG33_TRIPA|nr:hypothetical protein MKX07_008180 [Trichoderma sp. CBMAI-0711]OTA06427.1 hypothetical protein A9Z42_0071660 [Trichoderma parareesei]